MEGSFGWQWISDVLKERGMNPCLANSRKVDQMRQARNWPKTNRRDAGLVSLLPGEKEDWWRAWMAPPEVRELRELTRHRADVVRMQTQTKNRIHAVFHRHGVIHGYSDLFGAAGRGYLTRLCYDGGEYLKGCGLFVLRQNVMQLDYLRMQLAKAAAEIRKQSQVTPLTHHLRKTVPGFGVVLPHVVVAEVGEMERFGWDDGRLASYCLLAPKAQDSGEKEQAAGRKLGHWGNRVLKWAFLEGAHGAVRKGGLWRAMFDRYTRNGKTQRNRGYIKVGRALVKQTVKEWKKALEGGKEGSSVAAAPARGRHRRGHRGGGRTRSGTGEPKHPMTEA
jgi:transposase